MLEHHELKFRMLPGSSAIVRLLPDATVPAWATNGEPLTAEDAKTAQRWRRKPFY
jgi:hypothetical protein